MTGLSTYSIYGTRGISSKGVRQRKTSGLPDLADLVPKPMISMVTRNNRGFSESILSS